MKAEYENSPGYIELQLIHDFDVIFPDKTNSLVNVPAFNKIKITNHKKILVK